MIMQSVRLLQTSAGRWFARTRHERSAARRRPIRPHRTDQPAPEWPHPHRTAHLHSRAKSPYWHLSHAAGCWRATVYNRVYHPRGYVRPEDGGAAAEHEALTQHVTLWNRGRTADPGQLACRAVRRLRHHPRSPHRAPARHPRRILNEAWHRATSSGLAGRLRPAVLAQGVNVGLRMDVEIDEIDVCPVQIRGRSRSP